MVKSVTKVKSPLMRQASVPRDPSKLFREKNQGTCASPLRRTGPLLAVPTYWISSQKTSGFSDHSASGMGHLLRKSATLFRVPFRWIADKDSKCFSGQRKNLCCQCVGACFLCPLVCLNKPQLWLCPLTLERGESGDHEQISLELK